MALGIGTRLGGYEILDAIGAGGMGEVYRARDTKLGREVAVKVVSESFTDDPERMARFEREAQLLASLNHPHIATIHGLEQSGATHFLVMELVEGETLAEPIAGGPSGRPLPVSEALGLARHALGGTLFAVPFDERRLAVTGGAAPILEGVRRSASVRADTGSAQSASRTPVHCCSSRAPSRYRPLGGISC